MNESSLDKLRTAWRNSAVSEGISLEPEDVDILLQRQSRDVTHQFRAVLLLDIALKAVVSVALIFMLWVLRHHAGLTALTMALLVSLLCIGFEHAALKRIPDGGVAAGSLRSGLERMRAYYRERFKRALYLVGLSGPLVFYAGVVHYLWYRYGGLRPYDGADLAVFGLGLGLAYLLSAGAQQAQFSQYLNQVEACLREIEESGAEPAGDPLATLRARRLRHNLAWSAVLIAGVLLLGWLALR